MIHNYVIRLICSASSSSGECTLKMFRRNMEAHRLLLCAAGHLRRSVRHGSLLRQLDFCKKSKNVKDRACVHNQRICFRFFYSILGPISHAMRSSSTNTSKSSIGSLRILDSYILHPLSNWPVACGCCV